MARLANYDQQAISSPLPIFVYKILLEHRPIHLIIACGYFHAITAVLCGYIRDLWFAELKILIVH